MAVHVRFLSLTVTTVTTEKTYRFDQPATVISGASGSGKSSLLMLLKHTIGGTARLTPTVRDHVHSVRADVVLGTQHLILKRTISDDCSNHVDILDPDTMTLLQSLPVRSSNRSETLSDYLLQAIGFPRASIPSTRDGNAQSLDLTFSNLFAYTYMEAHNIDREVVGHRDTWFNRKRKELFKLMFALTDSALMELRLAKNVLEEQLKKKKAEYANVTQFLEASDSRSEEELRAELTGLRDILVRAENTLSSLRFELEENAAADTVLRQDLGRAVEAARHASQEVLGARDLVEARAAVVAQVSLDLSRLERSATAIDLLSPFDFVVCPRCMQRLENRPVPTDHCVVCLQHDPHDADVDPVVVQQARTALEEQLQDARAVQDADVQVLQRAREHAEQADFVATTVRRQLDALTRDMVAPRFEAIAQSSARVATLKATIDAVAQLRDFWTRARSINQTVRDITAQRKDVTAAIKARNAELQSRQTLVTQLSRSFRTILEDFQPPWEVESAVVDPDSYLPVVNDTQFENLQASGGGISACVNLAYSLALLEFGLTHTDVLVPSLLIIDSPRRAFGNNPDDLERSRRIYDRFKNLADTYGEALQLIVADNDTAPVPSDTFGKIELDYTNPLVPGVVHPGPGHTARIEDEHSE
jgi:AAA domain